ncbi:NLP/P60 protein [Syntrophobotulus glycolicus DSM 8271]|uniref:NLP/P60 protein n=1 Tax=Syntrophobotulus glycolicus (strain DSM 8271 / FlGlyR) TaxID=645991 RepID=F0T0X7_SYNGF|nr:C40 family peptidase [Syntrophobotulus glycolicus]ADY56266.1 NLP/P60 protein [Syntrophobotulus glycolicus DSM 8271]
MNKPLYMLLTPFLGLILLVSINTATAYEIPNNPYQQKDLQSYSVSQVADWGLTSQQIADSNSTETIDPTKAKTANKTETKTGNTTESKESAEIKTASSQRATPLSTASRGESDSRTTKAAKTSSKASVSAKASQSSTTVKSADQNKVDAIIGTAKKYLGVPYLYGGTTPSGFDCSGYVRYVFNQNGLSLPRTAREQYTVGSKVSSLQAGDLVFFSTNSNGKIDHVGIYLGGGNFINSTSSRGVIISSLNSYWQPRYVGAKRVL